MSKFDEALLESSLNAKEGEGQTKEEIAAYFGEEVKEGISLDENEDIYKVSSRIKNLARANGGNLTSIGEVLCNTYCHVIMDFYRFAKTLPEKDGEALQKLIKSHENMPANVIAI